MIKRLLPTFVALVVFLILFTIAYALLDPDFGWRFRAGQIILTSGFAKTDPFSYTMSSYPFVDHAWSQSVFFFIVFRTFGKVGLSIYYSLVALAAFYVAFLRTRKLYPFFAKLAPHGSLLGYFSVFPFFLLFAGALPFFGVRAQVMSWLMFSTLFLFIFNTKLFNKYKFLAPVFFLTWANLHGSFVDGLLIFFTFLSVRFFVKRKILINELVIFAVSCLFTLINPYGPGVWWEVGKSITDQSLRWNVSEWQPALTMLDLPMVFLFTLSFVFIVKQRGKFKVEEIAIYFLVLTQAMASRRLLPVFYLVAAPTTTKGIHFFWMEIRKVRLAKRRFARVYKYAFWAAIVVFVYQSCTIVKDAYFLSEKSFYPKAAASYLGDKLPEGNVFSEYGWGGYLIWKLPQKKVFIDGRMPSWRWDKGIGGESDNIMKEYMAVLAGEKEIDKAFEKWNIAIVLWPNEARQSGVALLSSRIYNFLSRFGIKNGTFDFRAALKSAGWKAVYSDSVATIYQKR